MTLRSWFTTAVAVLALLVGCRESSRYIGSAPPAESSHSLTLQLDSDGGRRYPNPRLDLPEERLSERVDGAEVKLRRLGCRRLRFWPLESPPAALEALTFADERGANQLLTDEVGNERSPNAPGDEGWIGSNALYFRWKAVLVRLIADAPQSADTLLAPAQRIERALASGEVAP